MILSSIKYCVTSENSLRWEIFQKRFPELIIYHNGRSYSEVCTDIVANNLDKDCFMIFEDDACAVNLNYLNQIVEIEKQLNDIHHWDILYLGSHVLSGNGNFVTHNILENAQLYCTHSVLYKASAYETLLTLTDKFPEIRPHAWDWMVDNSGLVKIAATPMIITQLESENHYASNVKIHNIMNNSHKNVHLRLLNEERTF
jgi:hypothetical protein